VSCSKEKHYEATIFPFLDSHVVPLVDEKWACIEKKPIRYIANKNGDILYKICNKFFMFAKNGELICQIKIDDKDDQESIQHKAISPNGKFLVYEIKSKELYLRNGGGRSQDYDDESLPSNNDSQMNITINNNNTFEAFERTPVRAHERDKSLMININESNDFLP